MTATSEWLAKARATDDPAGDLITDMRRESDWPGLFKSLEHMRAYFRSRRACPDTGGMVGIFF
jgi:hypothetical protein